MTRAKLKAAAAAVVLVAATALWSYAFIYEPLVQGRWLFAVSLVAAALFWAGLRETARRKAESIDYRRQ